MDGTGWWMEDTRGLNRSTKLIGINLSNDTVDKLYYLDDIKASNNGIDDVRFGPSGDVAYLSDTAGAPFVLNTTTGEGVWTDLVDAALTNSTLAASLGDYTDAVALTPSTGGSTIDGDGNLYFRDTTLLAIWKVTPEGYASILVQDDALVWTDQMWVTTDKKLWLPASHMRPGGNGLMAPSPKYIFTFSIDAGLSPIDHV
ncbi:hypothetical protein G6011_07489 [Alternaria panax]|uniref:Major royal jelly protein n=1 Tax=Alternaria panax TaxID=48097 RepID=A0AAD4FE25_9PLEO|nr:hypothetical protein G6011_07489 [Alternaria panax]